MADNKHTRFDLAQMQSLPLQAKIEMTKRRIQEWYEHWDGMVSVSFSGGKDSTVLLDIVRNRCGYKDVPAVFFDTGLEYPEIRKFAMSFDNVVSVKPKLTFKQVVEKYGYPFISKEVSECVYGARKYLKQLVEDMDAGRILADRQTDRQTDRPYSYRLRQLLGVGEYSDGKKKQELSEFMNQRINNREGGQNRRLAILLGWLTKDENHRVDCDVTEKDRSMFTQEKYKFFLFAPFEISHLCCNVMKKEPAHRYAKETGRKPMTAQMASESRLRTQKWIQYGCNGFDMKSPISNPMSFWTEQDVLLYIKLNNLPICSVYGDIVVDCDEDVDGQMNIFDYADNLELFDEMAKNLKTTGCQRTGCIYCGMGCHLEKGKGRFERLKETHPATYDFLMRPIEQGGLNYKEIIDWINENGGFKIKY